jgi:hypothetical protein
MNDTYRGLPIVLQHRAKPFRHLVSSHAIIQALQYFGPDERSNLVEMLSHITVAAKPGVVLLGISENLTPELRDPASLAILGG